MSHFPFVYLDDMVARGGMRAGDKGGPRRNQFFDGIDRMIDRSGRIGLGTIANGRSRRGLLLGQTVHKVVHDHVRQPDILPGAVVEMISADREAVAITPEKENMQIGTS